MAIRSAQKSRATESDAGKWGNPQTIWRDGICGRPILITRVAKSRVYYCDTHKVYIDKAVKTWQWELDEHEQFMKADSLVFICDTDIEAAALHRLSEEQVEELRLNDKAIREKYRKIVEEMC